MDTVIRVYSLFSFFIGPKTSLYGLNTSLVGQRTLLMSELDKLGALNLRAESEKVKNNYRTHLYRGDVLKRFYGSRVLHGPPLKNLCPPLAKPRGGIGPPLG